MNLLRGVGRAALASFYVANGVKAIREPETLVPAAEPMARAFVPFAQRTLPESVAAYVPEDTKNLVRLDGVLAVLGGLGMATGSSTRGGGTLAAVSMLPHLIASWPPNSDADAKTARSIFLRNLALTGAALVVSQDTRGNPSLAWRASDSAARLSRAADKKSNQLHRAAERKGNELSRASAKLSRRAERRAKKLSKNLQAALP